MNWVDAVIIGILAVFALEALGRPLLVELLDLVSFLLAGLVSFSFYNRPAKFFESQFSIPHGLTLVLGFMAVWFLSEIIFFFLVRVLLSRILIPKIPGSKVLAIIPAFLRGLIFIAIALVMVATFPIQPSVKKSVLGSKIGSQILKSAYQLESPVKSVFGGVANDSLTFLTIEPKTDEKVNLGFQTNQISVDSVSENAMIDLVNFERTSRGFKALGFDAKLRDIARGHSEDMFKRGYFSHYSPDPDLIGIRSNRIGTEGKTVADRALAFGVDFLVIGENLAYAPSIDLAHKGLMNSPGHKANILSEDFNKIGIGVADGGIYGKMFTQVFTN